MAATVSVVATLQGHEVPFHLQEPFAINDFVVHISGGGGSEGDYLHFSKPLSCMNRPHSYCSVGPPFQKQHLAFNTLHSICTFNPSTHHQRHCPPHRSSGIHSKVLQPGMAQEGASGRRISMGLWFIDLYGDVLRDSTAAATAADPSEEPESQSPTAEDAACFPQDVSVGVLDPNPSSKSNAENIRPGLFYDTCLPSLSLFILRHAFRWNTDCSDLWDYPQTSQQRKQQPDSKAGQTKCEPYLEKEPGRRMGMEDRQYTIILYDYLPLKCFKEAKPVC